MRWVGEAADHGCYKHYCIKEEYFGQTIDVWYMQESYKLEPQPFPRNTGTAASDSQDLVASRK